MKEDEDSKLEMVDDLKTLILTLAPTPDKNKLRAVAAGTIAQKPIQQIQESCPETWWFSPTNIFKG